MAEAERPALEAALVACGVAGVLARILLGAGHVATGAPARNPILYQDLWANLMGCAVMGALCSYRPQGAGAWYQGLTKGVCGCMTTFSGYEVTIAHQMLTCSGGCFLSVYEGVYSLAASWALCMGAFHAGRLVTPLLVHAVYWWPAEVLATSTPVPPRPLWAVYGLCAAASVIPSVWLGLSLHALLPWPLDYAAIPLSLLWAIPGVLLRVYVGILLPRGAGTLMTNVGATAISAACQVAWRAAYEPFPTPSVLETHSGVGIMIAAVSVGFCGALSTVSSVMADMHAMSPHAAIRYGLASVVSGQAVALGIVACSLGG